jgi:hypothetical protein
MPNVALTNSVISHEALAVLKNELSFTKKISRTYDSRFAVAGAKIGDTINVRKPPRYTVGTGAVMVPQDFVETSVPVRLDKQYHIGLTFSSVELLLDIDDFSRRVLQPAISQLANQIDYDGLQLYKTVSNYVGAPGVIPANLDVYLNAKAALSNCAAPMDAYRCMCINPNMASTIVFGLRGLIHSGSQIEKQYEKGEMGVAAGWNWIEDQNCPSHTKGVVLNGAPTVNGANQTGSSLVTQAWAAGNTLNEGDIIQIAGVFHVNPQNRQSTGDLQPFRVTANCTADAGGAMTIPLDPPITPSGAFQTVTASPAAGATITVFGTAAAGFAGISGVTHREGIGFHRDAFTLACADLPVDVGGAKGTRVTDDSFGLSLRVMQQYNITTDQHLWRIDVLAGWATLRPELAVRVLS